MAAGVLATANNRAVALLTLTSVACADNITAINNSNAEANTSSVVGWGLWARKRLKISVRLTLFIFHGSLFAGNPDTFAAADCR